MAGDMPWHLPADLKHFKQVTMSKPIIMGRRTYESIGRPLPGRRNIVISRQWSKALDGIELVHSLDEAIQQCCDDEEVMIIGGGQIYAQALPLADTLWLTEVDCVPDGDTWFPEIDPRQWREVLRETHPADERNAYKLTFIQLARRWDERPG
ncbi:MAG: type 3 dihydrofolate reductase [Wenzhouxiangellaceae bacterium]